MKIYDKYLNQIVYLLYMFYFKLSWVNCCLVVLCVLLLVVLCVLLLVVLCVLLLVVLCVLLVVVLCVLLVVVLCVLLLVVLCVLLLVVLCVLLSSNVFTCACCTCVYCCFNFRCRTAG